MRTHTVTYLARGPGWDGGALESEKGGRRRGGNGGTRALVVGERVESRVWQRAGSLSVVSLLHTLTRSGRGGRQEEESLPRLVLAGIAKLLGKDACPE
jgi:hypothetical protein